MDRVLDHRIGKYIALSHRGSMVNIGKELKKYDLKNTTFPILLNLEEKNPNTVNSIAKDIQYDKSVISRGIKELLELGFIRKEISPVNRSSFYIYITEEGKKLLPKIHYILKEWQDKILKDIEDKEKFMQNLESIIKNINNLEN